jgi:hypothetical protein
MSEIQKSTTPNAHNEDVVVLARSPQEMVVAQQGLVLWAERRLDRLRAALVERQENLAIAKKRKWKQGGWIKQVKIAEGRITFYEKVKTALEAGYCIMPDLPVQLLAVRTNKRRPRRREVSSSYGNPEHQLSDAAPNALPAGDGRYVTPSVFIDRWSRTEKNEKTGRDEITNFARAAAYDEEFDFPMKFVKPQILDATGQALALKLFDEIGILPATQHRRLSAMATSDPVVVGRIVREEKKHRHVLTFLITWWIDTSQI